MATLNTAKADTTLVSTLNTYDLTVFACAVARADLAKEASDLAKKAEKAENLTDRQAIDRQLTVIADKKKAVGAYEKAVLMGDEKTARAGLVDCFSLDYEALCKATAAGQSDKAVGLVRDAVQPFFPDGTKLTEITGFARKIVCTLGTVSVAGGKAVIEGKRTKTVAKAQYFKTFVAALTENMAKNAKTGVKIRNKDNTVVIYDFQWKGDAWGFAFTESTKEA